MISSVPIMWRLKEQRYRLNGSACPDCGQVAFPPREVCPHCSENIKVLFPVKNEKSFEEHLAERFLIESHA